MANRYHDHIRFGERERIYRSGEFVRFIYREIFSGLTVRTERRPEVISRLYCEMNFDDALRPRLRSFTDKASSSTFFTDRWHGAWGKRFQAEFPSAELLPHANPLSRVPSPSFPSQFLYAYCHSSHCASYEQIRRTKVSNELSHRKLSSVST